MEWYNARVLPNGLPELIYQITPAWIANQLRIVIHPRGARKGGRICCDNTQFKMELYPTVILAHAKKVGVLSFNYWLVFLETILHEIGHAVSASACAYVTEQEYKKKEDAYRYVEKLADDWKDEILEKIASRNPRLGQPEGWIGGLPGIYILRMSKFHQQHHKPDDGISPSLQDYRAYRCGGQYSLADVLDSIYSRCGSWPGGEYEEVRKTNRRNKRIIKRESLLMDITRHYIDKAGRKHLFFNSSEAAAVADRIEGLMRYEDD